MNYGRVYGAAMRHMTKFWKGENYDDEFHTHHIANAAWNLLCLLEFELRGEKYKKFDDRSKYYMEGGDQTE